MPSAEERQHMLAKTEPSRRLRSVTLPRHITRAGVDGLILAGLVFAGYLFVVVAPHAGTFGFDAFAYWAVNLHDPYQRTAGGLGAFTYSPVAARLFAIVQGLPFWQFLWLWDAILVGTVVWLGSRSPRAVLGLIAFPPVALELYHGNIHLLFAAAIVLGFRYPVAWAFVVLTKVTPGVGLVWFLVRREWRSLGIALGVTIALAAVSAAVDTGLWRSWIASLESTAGEQASVGQVSIAVPLALRLIVATIIVAWGGLTNRRWTVPVAATLGLPILWPSGFAVLAALWPIMGGEMHDAGWRSTSSPRPA